ncbi:AAA family ATPase [Litchfieldia salsa]|uniref:Pilus assembly protein CpaE n=1 Tax=Litchfieldia salsa TaxID=930152 RepID=A0A1H0UC13_9BACI|nr:AAA family ATPase [Litchfieldia salsa]SDP63729.1 pilus assembly protein CpaE [Litchfieldia salsa]
MQWLYFSDTNSPAEAIEIALSKRKHTLLTIYQLEDLSNQLSQIEFPVLFLKANTVYNVYDLAKELSTTYPHAYLILIVPDNMENIKKAMHVGASNLLRISADSEEREEVIKQAEGFMNYREKKDNGSVFRIAKNSKVISICSPKGGSGRTTVSVNLAAALAKQGKKVIVVDGNLQFGDVAMYMDLNPKLTIYEWVKEGYEHNNFAIDKYVMTHKSGVSILAAPPRPEFFEMITDVHLRTAIKELKRLCDVIIIDAPSYLSEVLLSCLEMSEDILLLLSNDLPVLKRNKLFLETLETFQQSEKVKLIMNQDPKNKKLEFKKIEQIMGKEFFFQLPYQETIVNNSISSGIPFVLSHTRSPISKGVLMLANKILVSQVDPIIEPRSKRAIAY